MRWHVVSAAGIRPDPAKIEQVRCYPVPTDATKVRQFLGLASYYRRYIPEFARIAHPLHRLTRKNTVFEWTEDCGAAFDELKECLITAPVLSLDLITSSSLRRMQVGLVWEPFCHRIRVVRFIPLPMPPEHWTVMKGTMVSLS